MRPHRQPASAKKRAALRRPCESFSFRSFLERETGFEPATLSLGSVGLAALYAFPALFPILERTKRVVCAMAIGANLGIRPERSHRNPLLPYRRAPGRENLSRGGSRSACSG